MDHMNHGTSMFSPLNTDLARRYWYTIAGFVGAFMLIRGVNFYKSQRRSVPPRELLVEPRGLC